jgi:hypothetical protein
VCLGHSQCGNKLVFFAGHVSSEEHHCKGAQQKHARHRALAGRTFCFTVRRTIASVTKSESCRPAELKKRAGRPRADLPASDDPTCGQTGSARPVAAACVGLRGAPCRPVPIYIYMCLYISCCCWSTGVLACLLLLMLLYLQLQGTPGQGPGAFPSCTP